MTQHRIYCNTSLAQGPGHTALKAAYLRAVCCCELVQQVVHGIFVVFCSFWAIYGLYIGSLARFLAPRERAPLGRQVVHLPQDVPPPDAPVLGLRHTERGEHQ